MGGDISYTLIIQVNKLGSGQGLIERPVQKPIELALKKWSWVNLEEIRESHLISLYSDDWPLIWPKTSGHL